LLNPPIEAAPDNEAVASELERLAVSASFRKAERCMRLLRYITTIALEGRETELKEYSLGVSGLGRPESFDPRTDPVVRLEARRLRLKLAEYYQHEGLDDPVVIELPKGAYVPRFRLRNTTLPSPPAAAAVRPSRTLWMFGAVVACGAILAAWYIVHKRSNTPGVRESVAVLGFRDLSGNPATSWINPAISELMNIELGAGQLVRTFPPENVARMQTELSVTPAPVYSSEILRRIGVNLGSDYAVAGAYLPSENQVRLDVVLFDLRTGRQVAAISESSDRTNLLNIAQESARRLRAQLGVRLATGPGAQANLPVTPAAMEAYSRGMERLRQSDALGARPYLERARLLEPSNPLVHSGLAATWSMLGMDGRAAEEAKQAFDSSAALGRVEQLEIEGRYCQTAHVWPRAIQVYQALFTLLPDDLENGLLLAAVQTQAGKAQDAAATVSALRRLPSSLRDDPRIDLAEAQSAGALSDFNHTRQAAHAAAEKALRRGARLQYARARMLESGAMQNMSIAGFASVREEARGICAELGDRACVAAAYRIQANNLATTGAPRSARPLYAKVLEVANEIGNQLEKLNALTGLGYTENLMGDLLSAEADYRAALAVGTAISRQKRYPVCLELARVLAAQGKFVEARALGEEALQASQSAEEQESIALSKAALADALALEGRFPESIAQYTESVAILQKINEAEELARVLLALGNAEVAQGNPAEARKSYGGAQDLDRKYGGFVRAEIAEAFARLALAEGHAETAEAYARTAMETFAAAGRAGDRLAAAALLARALLARGDPAQASAVLDQILPLDERALPIDPVIRFGIARSLVAASLGHRAEAGRTIDTILSKASHLGLRHLAQEAVFARSLVTKVQVQPNP
jgi:tetratricopeptide (TPR) repeat protein